MQATHPVNNITIFQANEYLINGQNHNYNWILNTEVFIRFK